MIISGNRATKTGHQSLFGTKCNSCSSKEALEMYTFSRYFHIFWVPFFPYRKEAITQCNHCKQILNKKEFSSDLSLQYEEMKTNIKTPYWQYIGGVLFVVLIISIFSSIKEDNKRDIAFLNAPQPGDIYKIRTPDGQYTLYKVSEVKSDSVYVLFNEFETNKQSGLRQVKMNEATSFITEDYLPIAKKDLMAMKEKGEIQGVIR